MITGLAVARQLGPLWVIDRRVVAAHALAASLIGLNWLLYVWAVNSNQVIDVSLGYFINPILSVVLGVVVLGERLRTAQWVAVVVAGAGVGALIVGTGRLPWVSLVLASSFGGYGLLKKLAPLPALQGLTLETLLLAPFALAFLAAAADAGTGALGGRGVGYDALLVGSGVLTALPLVWFGVAARRLPLSVVGLLQYVAPSMQLLLGVFWFGEAFGTVRALAFGLVWCGLLAFSLDGLRQWRHRSGRSAGSATSS